MTALIAIVLIIGFAYLNSRISDLERLIRGERGELGSVARASTAPERNISVPERAFPLPAPMPDFLAGVPKALERVPDPALEGGVQEGIDVPRGASVGSVFKQALEGGESGVQPAPNPAPAPLPSSGPAPLPSEAPLPPAPRSFADASQEESGARALLRVGIAAIFFGVVYFFKFAFENDWIGPVFLEFVGVAIGLAMAGAAQYLLGRSEKYRHYSAWLAGGGIALLYLTIFAGAVWWQAETGLSQPIAFAFMSMVTAFAMVLAVLGQGMALALVGVIGGFLTPVMLSSGENHFVALSIYMLILNCGVLGVSLFRKWPILNWLSLAGTTLLYMGWSAEFYRAGDGQLWTAFFFVCLFYLVFLANTLLRHCIRREPATSTDALFAVLVIALYFGESYRLLLPSHENALGFFALFLSALYVAFGLLAYHYRKEDRVLEVLFPSIAVVLFSVAIPLQFDGHWITFAWLTQSAALFALAFLADMKHLRAFGWGTLAIGMLSLIDDIGTLHSGTPTFTPFANIAFVMEVYATMILAFVATIHWYDRLHLPNWKQVVGALALVANMLMISSLTTEVYISYEQDIAAVKQSTYLGERPSVVMGRTIADYGDMSAIRSLENERNTVVSVLWTIYALLLIGIGFAKRIRYARVLGLVFFFITAMKVFLEVWQLSKLYRAISLVAFGVLALVGSFLYVRYQDRLRSIIAKDE